MDNEEENDEQSSNISIEEKDLRLNQNSEKS